MLNSIGVRYNITVNCVILLYVWVMSYFHLYFSLQNRRIVNYYLFPTKVKKKIVNKISLAVKDYHEYID